MSIVPNHNHVAQHFRLLHCIDAHEMKLWREKGVQSPKLLDYEILAGHCTAIRAMLHKQMRKVYYF